MKAVTIFLVILFSTLPTFACVNIVGTKYSGERGGTIGRMGVQELRYAFKRNTKPDGIKMEADLRGSTNFSDRSNYAVALMYLGRSQEAVQLLESLEKESPGEFYVAGNLGTAYELSGNNESALKWIQEEIKRNPEAHEAT